MRKLNEGKNVGVIYHHTNITSLMKILKSGEIIDSVYNRGYISFTRNGYDNIKFGMARIVLDGDKLSNKYSIVAASRASSNGVLGPLKNPENFQSEERIYKTSVNIDKYIIQIDILKDYASDDLTPEEKKYIESNFKLNLVDSFKPVK